MPSPPTFDLQSHSTCSDGALLASDVVAAAAAAGVEVMALTDHDSVDGVEDALQAGERHGVRVIPAVELSSVDGEREDLHVLGYRVDHRDPTFLRALERFRGDRSRRTDLMVERLRDELGFALDTTVLDDRARRELSIGRPHVAGAVLNHPDNAERLAAEGIGDTGNFIATYLIKGAPGYVGRTTPTVEQAIRTIHEAGGIAIWAHPFWDIPEPEKVLETIDRFQAMGVDGIEAFYATHTREQTHLLVDRCTALGLLTTGSADFHGPEHPNFPRFRAFELYDRAPDLGPLLDAATR